MEEIKIFFANLFPEYILGNKIIATIIFNLSEHFGKIQEKIDKQINTDI